MGAMTEQMEALTNGIFRAARDRRAFVKELKETVPPMRARFREAHAEMARKSRAERSAFLADLKAKVAELQEGFRAAHAEMASEVRGTLEAGEAARLQEAQADRAQRLDFVRNLREEVAHLLGEFAADIEGARRAWFGSTPVHGPAD